MRAGSSEGWLISRREPAREPAVTINARTGRDGYVVAELLDRKNRVLPGFARSDCVPFNGDAVGHELRWKTARFASGKAPADYKIRFWLKDADLFSYLPQGLDPNQPDFAPQHQIGS
jgi:hypothetical protein